MSEIKIKNRTQFDEPKWFGIKLGRTSKAILFYMALIGVIEGTNLLYSFTTLINYIQIFGFPSEYVSRQIFYIITGVTVLILSLYTLVIIVLSKKRSNNTQNDINATNKVIRIFGFTLSQTAAILIFFVALVGIPPTISSLYSYSIYLKDLVQSFIYYGVEWNEILGVVGIFQIVSTLISKLILFIYSIVRYSQVRKNMARRE
ncbi:MAG: hypothetical protein ACFE9C_04770 [Candidatus Hodarchaeota archaeon]